MDRLIWHFTKDGAAPSAASQKAKTGVLEASPCAPPSASMSIAEWDRLKASFLPAGHPSIVLDYATVEPVTAGYAWHIPEPDPEVLTAAREQGAREERARIMAALETLHPQRLWWDEQRGAEAMLQRVLTAIREPEGEK